MKKIFFICNRYTANQDIINKKFGRQINIAKGLTNLSYKVILYCADYKKRENLIEEYKGIKIYSSKLNLLFILDYIVKLFNIIKAENPDLIIGGSVPLWGLIGFLIALTLHKKYVFDIQDNYESLGGSNAINLSTIINNINLLFIKNIMVVSEKLLNKYKSTKKNIIFIPNSIDLNKFKPINIKLARKKWNFEENIRYIGYSGTIAKNRGIKELQEAFLELSKEQKNIRLVLAGGINDEKIYDNKNIIYLGNLSPSKIPSLINALDLFIIPNPPNVFTEYSFPYKCLEVLACNKKVLMSRTGVLNSLHLESNFYLTDVNNISLFKDEIKAQLNNNKNYDFRKKATKYSLNNVSLCLDKYFSNIIRKRVAIICDNVDEDERGGTANYALNLANNLNDDDDFEFILVHKKQKDNLFLEKRKELIIPNYGNNFLFNTIRKVLIMPFVLLLNGIDLVHETYQMGPFILPNFPYKKIVTIHDIFFKTNPKTHNIISRLRHTLSLPIILKNVDLVITDSKSSKDDLIKHYKLDQNKIKVIYLGTDISLKTIKNNKKLLIVKKKFNLPDKFILTVASIEPRKNILSAVKSINELRDKAINIPYIIIGKKIQPYFSTVQSYIESHDLNKNIKILNYVESKDLPFIYNLAHIFLFPSLYEGFGLPVLEAMASGCPVITSNISSLPEVVEDSGLLIKPSEISSITEGLFKLIKNDSLRLLYIKSGLNRASKLTWENCSQSTKEVYKELLFN